MENIYYIAGSSNKKTQQLIKESFVLLGAQTTNLWDFDSNLGIYFIDMAHKLLDFTTHTSLLGRLIKQVGKPLDLTEALSKTFKEGDIVLVRDTKENPWVLDVFKKYDPSYLEPYRCERFAWKYCIKYKGNEHLHGKSDSN